MAEDFPKTVTPAEGKFEQYFFPCLLIVLSFLIGFFKIYSSDIWWHIKTGEIILSHGIPRTDPFSFTAIGNPWITHEWLAEIFLYMLYRVAGIAGLITFKGIISAAIAYILYHFGRVNKVSPAPTAATAIFAVAGMSYMIYARPHVFTFLFLAILTFFLFKPFRDDRSFKIERWVFIPLIFWLWANSHAGFILGLGIYWVVVAREVLLPGSGDRTFTKRLTKSALPAILATLVCLLNPNGFKIFTYTIMIAGNPAFKSKISEWVSPLFLGPDEWLARAILFIASALGLFAMIKHLKKKPDVSIIILATAVSAWFAMRNIQNFVIVLSFALLSIPSSGMRHRLKSSLTAKRNFSITAVFWIVLCFLLVRDYQKNNGRLGYGLADGAFPVNAAEFLKKVGFKGNIVNVLGDGGYLIWAGYPDWKVYIDGRLDVYGEALFDRYRETIQGGSDALGLFDKLDVGAAVLPMPPLMGNVRTQLATDSRWVLVYFDDFYLIYLKRTPDYRNTIDRWGFSAINPIATGYGLNPTSNFGEYDIEARRNININPKSGLANSICGLASQNKGEFIPATGYYKKALEIQPRLRELNRTIAELYISAGIFDSAKVWLDKAQKFNPNDSQVYLDFGYLYGKQNDLDKAEYYLNEAVKRDSNSPARQLLGKLRASRIGH
jgi:tetratricopeptide (TPR) repeat protein